MTNRFHPGRILTIASASLLIIACFLPWAKLSLLGISKTVTGIQGDGKILVGIAVIVLVLIAISKIRAWIPGVLVLLAGLIAVFDYINLSAANEKLDGISEIAFGFYLIPVAVTGMLAGCVWASWKVPNLASANQTPRPANEPATTG